LGWRNKAEEGFSLRLLVNAEGRAIEAEVVGVAIPTTIKVFGDRRVLVVAKRVADSLLWDQVERFWLAQESRHRVLIKLIPEAISVSFLLYGTALIEHDLWEQLVIDCLEVSQ